MPPSIGATGTLRYGDNGKYDVEAFKKHPRDPKVRGDTDLSFVCSYFESAIIAGLVSDY